MGKRAQAISSAGFLLGSAIVLVGIIPAITHAFHFFFPPEITTIPRHAVDLKTRLPIDRITYGKPFGVLGEFQIVLNGCFADFAPVERVLGTRHWQGAPRNHPGSFPLERSKPQTILRTFIVGPAQVEFVPGMYWESRVEATWNCFPWLGPLTEWRQTYTIVRLPIVLN